MAEYIERDIAAAFANNCGAVYVANRLSDSNAFPAADVAPVVHGRWDDSGRYTFPSGNTAVRCTNCGCALAESEYHLYNWNYCPICGARMDGDDDAKAD